MINKELLRRTLEHIKSHPEEWDQKRWGRCFAGWTVRLDNPSIAEQVEQPCCDACGTYVDLYENERRLDGDEIRLRAGGLLGLDPIEAWRVFDQTHTLEDLERIVDALLAEPAGEEVSA